MSRKKEQNVDNLPYKQVSGWYRFVKRFFDIFLSALAILLLSWLLLIIVLLVFFTSKGPAIFRDHRVGKDGKEIHVYKFRSMYVDAEERITEYLDKKQLKQWKKERKVDHDPRVTPVGKVLRKTSLDELPQLFNILFGTMSIIGPRPITTFELKKHFTPEEQQILLSARPGLIGYWAVKGRSDISYANGERQKLELDYFKLRGLFFDLSLIFRVIPTIVRGKGAK